MRTEWEQYLLSKVQLQDAQTRYKKKPKSSKGFGILDGIVPVTPTSSTEVSSASKQEHTILLAAASEIRKKAKLDSVGETSLPQVGIDTEEQGKAMNKRNKKATKNNNSRVRKGGKKAAVNKDQSMLHSEGDGQLGEVSEGISGSHPGDGVIDVAVDHGSSWDVDPQTDDTEDIRSKPLPQVQFYALESHKPILDVLKPSVVIVYHPDMTFVREIEVYKAENPSKKLKVYFLFYEDSTEGQKFDASIRRENKAFESLIRQKSLMIIPVDQVQKTQLFGLMPVCLDNYFPPQLLNLFLVVLLG